MGNAKYDLSEPKESIKFYKKALELDSSLADVHYNLGNAFYLLEDTENAIKHY